MTDSIQYVIYVMVFASAFLAMQAVIMSSKEAGKRVRLANARLKRLAGGQTHMAVIEKMRKSRRLNEDSEFRALYIWLGKLSTQAGISIDAGRILMISLILAVIFPALIYIASGSLFLALPGCVFGLCLPVMVLRFFKKRRLAKIGQQLAEALDVIIRSLSAGHPVPVAMNMVAQEMADPIGSEFGIASDEITYGASLGDGVQRMAERVGHDDFHLFAATVRLQERTGGNLAELLRANAKTIRARQRMRLKIKAASAEGRMSAIILNIAPIILYIAVNLISPEFYGELEGNRIIKYGLGFAVIWMIIGNLVMRKMIAFRI